MSGKRNLLRKLAGSAIRRAKRPVSRLISENYRIAKLRFHTRLRLGPSKNPVLVYTMGKVGSTAVARSLKAAGEGYRVYHLHWLVPEHLRLDEALHRAASRRNRHTPLRKLFSPEYVWRGQYLSKQVQAPQRDGSKWNVITLIRDPVARNVSAFFQNVEFFFGYDWRVELRVKDEEQVVAELVDLFRNNYVNKSEAIRMDGDPLTWFDDELKAVFGVDVFDHDFPADQGFKMYEAPLANVLLIRLEDLDSCAPQAFEQFLGLKAFETQRANVAANKAYTSLYDRFLHVVDIPGEYLDKLYGAKASTHFYTEEELAKFRARWKR